MDNEFILIDRLQKIRQVIEQYGEENFYLSFSGGKDSTVLSALLDMAIPGNTIPRVYANTGIEYQLILDFVERERERACVGIAYHQAKPAN
jgi:3'-phosphoadenosine 5'-phosphosulfate sulfotransferase (PAPS reductase)/FAD synthetase